MQICILFPAFCHGLLEPDPEFHREQRALEALVIPWRVVNIAALERQDITFALKYVGDVSDLLLIYRGWILHPEEYAALSDALAERGSRLLTSPSAYRRALLFPEFFPHIADYSFPAAWIAGTDANRALQAARNLGPPPYFIKDYAKSAKEIWPAGCVVNSDREMKEAIRALKDYRGERFEGGIVIRPLLKLRYLEESPFGGNIYEEYRLFFFLGVLISRTAYDRVGGDAAALPDYHFLPQRIDSPFFTADVVVTEDGRRYLLEVGDGGSSALPPMVSPVNFYEAILSLAAKLDS